MSALKLNLETAHEKVQGRYVAYLREKLSKLPAVRIGEGFPRSREEWEAHYAELRPALCGVFDFPEMGPRLAVDGVHEELFGLFAILPSHRDPPRFIVGADMPGGQGVLPGRFAAGSARRNPRLSSESPPGRRGKPPGSSGCWTPWRHAFGPMPAMHWSSRTTLRGPPSDPADQSCGGAIDSNRSKMPNAAARS